LTRRPGIATMRVGWIRGLATGAGLSLTILEIQASPNADRTVLALDVAVGWAFLVAGLVIVGFPNARPLGLLAMATGGAWFVGALSDALSLAYAGPLVHLLIGYPTGRVRGTIRRAVVIASYALAIVGPSTGIPGVGAGLAGIAAVGTAVAAASSHGAMRRARIGALLAALGIVVASGALALAVEAGVLGLAAARIGSATTLIVAALALTADLQWGGWSRDALVRLVVDLGDQPEPTTLRDRLAEAMDDPTLVIGYRLDDGTYVDDAGEPIVLPAAEPNRLAVNLRAAGNEVGVLVRDQGWPGDEVLAQGVAAAAELALGNARLQAVTRRQLVQLQASRTRLIAAAERERKRIQRELAGGAQRRLALVRDGLAATDARGPDGRSLVAQTDEVIAELQSLSEGLGPSSVLDQGLEHALRTLARAPSLEVHVSVDAGRLPPLVKATAWFVCSEGLANVVKHAEASRAWIRAREANGVLRVEVVDDGKGGARPSPGSGLDGLRQRVTATGGRLVIETRPDGGTRLVAELPLDRQAGRARDQGTRSNAFVVK
jgi:signal transduction histidine kinase